VAGGERNQSVRRRFFVERFAGNTATLRGEAAHHLGRVLRAQAGQLYELSDGSRVFLARIERAAKDAIEFALLEPVPIRESRVKPTVLLAIVKFDRFEWALEKATELGAEAIIPLAAERSEKGLVVAAGKRAERWRKILLESAQQARCLHPPVLGGVMRPGEAFATAAGKSVRIVFSERAAAYAANVGSERALAGAGRESSTLREILADSGLNAAVNETQRGRAPLAISVAIGPEGGWTDAELDSAVAAGFREASLGGNILRTETAVAAALASIRAIVE